MKANIDIIADLSALTSKKRFCVALSGGLDSQVLLHLMVQSLRDHPHLTVRAIHIHHGLSINADAWVESCRQTCQQLEVGFTDYRLNLNKQAGDSLEAVARQARYRCLADALDPDECLLTAHHADDQAETLLLQLLRGAGVAGLAAMPMHKPFFHTELARPLLRWSRADIEQYAKAHHLQWVEDDSNDDEQLSRNYLRRNVMPLIKQRWPQALITMARSAQHCATAKELLEELAHQDLALLQTENNTLDIRQLTQLPHERQQMVLRSWMRQHHIHSPSQMQLQQLFQTVIHSAYDAIPCINWGSYQLRRYRYELYLIKPRFFSTKDLRLNWNLREDLELPEALGYVRATLSTGMGLTAALLGENFTLCFRQGGERIKPAGRQSSQSLKKLMQTWNIPPWQRNHIPLLYFRGQLIAVVGYCVAEGWQALPAAGGLVLEHRRVNNSNACAE